MSLKIYAIIASNLLANLALQVYSVPALSKWLMYAASVLKAFVNNSAKPKEPSMPVSGSPIPKGIQRWLSFAVVQVESVADIIASIDPNDTGKDDEVASIMRKVASVIRLFIDDMETDSF